MYITVDILRQRIGCKERGFTEVYSRLGDEDFVGNVLRLSGRPLRLRRYTGRISEFDNFALGTVLLTCQ